MDDFVFNFFAYNIEFLSILDSLVLHLDMICIIYISIYIVVFIHSFFYKNIFYKNIEAEICEY